MKSALLALCLALPAQAAVLGYVPGSAGARIDFHDSSGACVSGAKHAEYIAPDGFRTPGCWTFDGQMFRVVFFDSDAYRIPLEAVKTPTPS